MTNHWRYDPRGPLTLRPVSLFFGDMSKDWVFVPPLPCDLTDLKAQIIAAVKHIAAPMLTRVARTWISYWCVLSPMVHASNISSLEGGEPFQFSRVCEQSRRTLWNALYISSVTYLERRFLTLKTWKNPASQHSLDCSSGVMTFNKPINTEASIT